MKKKKMSDYQMLGTYNARDLIHGLRKSHHL